MSAKIRLATVRDAAAIAAVHVRSWQAAYRGQLPDELLDNLSVPARRDSWAAQLANEFPVVLVALDERAVIGFAALGPAREDDASKGNGELYAIYLLPEYWGQGVGSNLHQAALDELTQRGFRHAILWVFVTNDRTRAIYEHWGWTPDGGLKQEQWGHVELREARYAREL